MPADLDYCCRDFLGWGHKPNLELLDKLLACLRLQPPTSMAQREARAANTARAQALTASLPARMGPAQAAAMLMDGACPVDDEPCERSQAALRELASTAERRMPAGSAGDWPDDEATYEVPFDRRALDVVMDAINSGMLPALKVCIYRH